LLLVELATAKTEGRTIEVLAIPGSVGVGSFDITLIDNAAREAPDDVRLMLYTEPGLWSMPPYAPGAQPNEGVERLRSAVAFADALLFATPEYNGSIPAVIKNAIDWMAADLDDPPPPIIDKPVAVVGADAGSLGCDWAIADARKVLEVAGARVLPSGLEIRCAASVFAEDGRLTDHAERARLGALMELLTVEARVLTAGNGRPPRS
jgi:chromate reductase, NAD(P)H dehydrogenase (quinone)